MHLPKSLDSSCSLAFDLLIRTTFSPRFASCPREKNVQLPVRQLYKAYYFYRADNGPTTFFYFHDKMAANIKLINIVLAVLIDIT